jgi:MFS family permease
MLGMFLILPVFALYAEHLPGGQDHTLVGIALGAYGLTQAVLQIPFGWLSDRYGRKPTIYGGLVLFAIGSLVAAMATNIYIVILGRVIQGSGAISAAVIALTADLTREEHRTKAMALIGMTIGLTFGVSLIAGPALNHFIGVPGIFALTGVLAILAIFVVYSIIPNPKLSKFHSDAETRSAKFMDVLKDPQLARTNYGIFALHASLMALFIVVPFALRRNGLDVSHHWQIYLPVMFASFVLMVPAIIYAEKRGSLKLVFVCAVITIFGAQVLLATQLNSLVGIGISLLVFFTAFNLLEASLPSLISKIAPANAKGTAIGVYSSVQFFGTFVGAAVGGGLSQHLGTTAVFAFCGALMLSWIVLAITMKAPPAVRTKMYPVHATDDTHAENLTRQLAKLSGVREALVLADEGVAYLKVDMRGFDERNVMSVLGKES